LGAAIAAAVVGVAPSAGAVGYSKATFDTCQIITKGGLFTNGALAAQCSVPDTDVRPKANISALVVNVGLSVGVTATVQLCINVWNAGPSCPANQKYTFTASSAPALHEFIINPNAPGAFWSSPSNAVNTPFFTVTLSGPTGFSYMTTWEADY
jgi:hypothetical protein